MPTAGPVASEPERTALNEVVRDNLETLYGAIEDGAPLMMAAVT